MKLIRSFQYAFQGLRAGLQEHNMRFHLLIALLVILSGTYFSITLLEWAILIVCIGQVLMAELFNTALEEIGDAISEISPKAYAKMGKPKDIAAAAVLVAAVVTAAAGLLIFIPYGLTLLW